MNKKPWFYPFLFWFTVNLAGIWRALAAQLSYGSALIAPQHISGALLVLLVLLLHCLGCYYVSAALLALSTTQISPEKYVNTSQHSARTF